MPPPMQPKEFAVLLRDYARDLPPNLVKQVQRKLCLEGLKRVVLRTPVDTGRARANWQLGVGSRPTGVLPDTDPKGDGAATIARETPKVRVIPNYDVVFISNNVEYVPVLEFGGFVPKDPANDAQSNKRRAQGRSKAKQAAVAAHFGDPGAPLVRGGFAIQAPLGMAAVTVAELTQVFKPLADQAGREVIGPETKA